MIEAAKAAARKKTIRPIPHAQWGYGPLDVRGTLDRFGIKV
jgi:hypothetical protein